MWDRKRLVGSCDCEATFRVVFRVYMSVCSVSTAGPLPWSRTDCLRGSVWPSRCCSGRWSSDWPQLSSTGPIPVLHVAEARVPLHLGARNSPTPESEVTSGTPPQVGVTRKVGGTSPPASSKPNMAAACINSSENCSFYCLVALQSLHVSCAQYCLTVGGRFTTAVVCVKCRVMRYYELVLLIVASWLT